MTGPRSFHIAKNFLSLFVKQRTPSPQIIMALEAKAIEAEKLTATLKKEVFDLQKLVNSIKASGGNVKSTEALRKENEKLREEISQYKKLLTGRDVGPVAVAQEPSKPEPSSPKLVASTIKPESEKAKPVAKKDVPVNEEKSKKKEKAPAKPATEEAPVDVGRLDFRVGKIVNVNKHPDADSLYVEKIDVGEDKPRTVVSGLVKHVPIEEMQGRMVVVLANLKPAKMRGVTSEAMVMCASTPEKVEILSPPEGCVPGDLVHVDGYPRVPDPVLNPKKKIFETVAPDLKTDAQKVATFKGVPWTVPGKGFVTTTTLTEVNIK